MEYRLSVYLLISFKLYMVKADCNSLPVVLNTKHNVTVSPPYVSGTVVHFECNDEYNPTGSSKDYECSGSTWIEGDLTCEQRHCTFIHPPENGHISNTPTYAIGTVINFACNTGYRMIGSSQLVCRIDVDWSPRIPPVCESVKCPEYGSVEHATTFQDNSFTERNSYGSVTKVTCNMGYILEGSPEVKCQANGQWENKPVCSPSACQPYQGFNSSCIRRSQVILNGQVLFIMCMEGDNVSVTQTGPDSAECKNQQWDVSRGIMNCYCDCKIQLNTNVLLQNLNSKGYLKHADTLSWTCKDDWIRETTQAIVCVDGKSDSPRCRAPTISTVPSVTSSDDNTRSMAPSDTSSDCNTKSVASRTAPSVTSSEDKTMLSSSTVKLLVEVKSDIPEEAQIGIFVVCITFVLVVSILVFCLRKKRAVRTDLEQSKTSV